MKRMIKYIFSGFLPNGNSGVAKKGQTSYIIPDCSLKCILTHKPGAPVPKLSPSASVTGGQVQIRWAGFAWH